MAECLGKLLASDVFESFSAGSAIKPQINQDAVRLIKEHYGIDMEATQHSKVFKDIPTPDIIISMGCDVACPYVGKDFDDNWQLPDPTGKSDEEFMVIIKAIENHIIALKEKIQSSYQA